MPRAAHEAREPERAGFTPLVLVADPHYLQWGIMSSRKRSRFLELIGSLVVAVPADYTRYL